MTDKQPNLSNNGKRRQLDKNAAKRSAFAARIAQGWRPKNLGLIPSSYEPTADAPPMSYHERPNRKLSAVRRAMLSLAKRAAEDIEREHTRVG